MTEKIRLQRYLASAGVAARRKAEELIVAGQVRVNGKQVRLLGTKVDAARDYITVNGEAVHPLDNFYVILNKPKGCVTAVEDDRGRPTVMEYLPNLPIPVRPVGRLDFYAEGVVLLTNDGDLSSRLVSSQRQIPKTYHVKVRGEIAREQLDLLRTGVRLDDGTTTLPAEVNFLPGESRHAWIGITTVENKQHQVQRMMEALGYQVQKLQCVAFANLNFYGLRVGDARELTQLELNALRDLVGLDHSVDTRGAWRSVREDTDIPRRAREKLRVEAAEAADAEGPAPEAWREADEDRAPRRSSAAEARGASSDRGARSARPSTTEARAPRAAAEARGPRRRPEDRAPRRPEDRAPRRPEDRAPRRPEDRAPRRPEDRAPRAPRRPEDRAPRAPRRAPTLDRAARSPAFDRTARRDPAEAPRRGPSEDRAGRRGPARAARPAAGSSFAPRAPGPRASSSRAAVGRDERPFGGRGAGPRAGREQGEARTPRDPRSPRAPRSSGSFGPRSGASGTSRSSGAASTGRSFGPRSTPGAKPSRAPGAKPSRAPGAKPSRAAAAKPSRPAAPAGRPPRRK